MVEKRRETLTTQRGFGPLWSKTRKMTGSAPGYFFWPPVLMKKRDRGGKNGISHRGPFSMTIFSISLIITPFLPGDDAEVRREKLSQTDRRSQQGGLLFYFSHHGCRVNGVIEKELKWIGVIERDQLQRLVITGMRHKEFGL